MRPKPARPRAAGRDSGQVSVEFLGTLPWVLVALVVVWQFVLVGYTFTLAGHAASEAARAAAVTEPWGRAAACTAAAEEDLPDAWESAATARCDAGAPAGVVTASVRLKVPVLFPGFAAFPFSVTGEAGAASED
ncbi:TadE/TadG family type IV pilus assembly protein [Streptomyces sp. TR06-5]|uniref:TadE/TadG family type IV pilus assembly protein n=1 Tax=unclassified Streptomyces TaxID=2593676 RepID=UPI0039A1D0A7